MVLIGGVYGKCVNIEAIERYTECRGTCGPITSNTELTGRNSDRKVCCLMSKYEKVLVSLLCEDGTELIVNVYMPKECICHDCYNRWFFLQ